VSWLVVAVCAISHAQDTATDFARWDILDREGRLMRYLGRQSLFLDRGIALMPDVLFADGTIEFDVAVHGQFGFAGVLFRAASADDYELIYVRTHRSRQWDALQYTPINRGQESWQIYAGAGYNAAAELPANRWVHVRIVVDGYSAQVFVDGAATPQLSIRDLKRDWRPGRVGLWGRSGAANFSNVKVTPADRQRPTRSSAAAEPGIISRWLISQSLPATTVDFSSVPVGLTYDPVNAEASGLVNIAQHRSPAATRPANDDGRNAVFAKAVLRAPRALRARVSIGFSDDVIAFLDGRPLFAGRSGYLFRDGSDLGTLTLGADVLYIDLTPGRHELVFAVIEAFGGWGFAAKIDGTPDLIFE
jgi:hypothetical protein